MFSADKAIEEVKDDLLTRNKFAKTLGDSIANSISIECFVLSINGTWGSGKSSVINLVKKHIETKYTDKIKLITFNPWFYTDSHSLIMKFFGVLLSEIRRVDKDQRNKKILETIEKYSENFEQYLSSLAPPAGVVAKIVASIAKKKKKSIDERINNIEYQRQEVREAFKTLDYKFLVTIDDIDRLNKNEVKDIFQLVKLVGDIPNIVYLLSFDRDIVCHILNEFHNSKGAEYLEKIVQVPFELPLATSQELESYLFKKIDGIISQIPQENFEFSRWQELYREGMRYHFKTIRHINRYINVFEFDFDLLKNEVDVVDLLGITFLKVFYPSLYDVVRISKNTLLQTSSNKYDLIGKDTKEYAEEIKQLFNLNLDNSLKKVLMVLFPKTYCGLGDGFFSKIEDNYNNNRLRQRICDENYFDMYFLLRIPTEMVTKSEINEFISIHNQNSLREFTIKIRDSGKITSLLDKLEDYTKTIDISKIENIISVLLDIGDSLLDRTNSDWLYSNEVRISRITYQLLTRIDNPSTRSTILENAIANSKESLYTPTREIAANDELHGRYTDTPKEELNKTDWLIGENELDNLEKMGKQKIENWLGSGELINVKGFLSILHWWKNWGGEKELKKYIDTFYQSTSDLIKLLTKFLKGVRSVASAGYDTNFHYFIQYDQVKFFLDVNRVYNMVTGISEIEIEKLNSEEKEAVKLFKENFEGKVIRR